MQKIICFSASDKQSLANFNKTVIVTLKPSDLTNSINDHNADTISVWGSKERNWKKIDTNDIVLFYSRKHFISYGRVIGKLIDPYIAHKLWGTREYKYLIIMTPNKPVKIVRDKFWNEFKYHDKMYIMGTYIPNIKIQQELIKKHGSIDELVKYVLEIKELDA